MTNCQLKKTKTMSSTFMGQGWFAVVMENVHSNSSTRDEAEHCCCESEMTVGHFSQSVLLIIGFGQWKRRKGRGFRELAARRRKPSSKASLVSQTAETTDGKPDRSLSLLALNHYQTSHVYTWSSTRLPNAFVPFALLSCFLPIPVHVTVTIGSSASSGV